MSGTLTADTVNQGLSYGALAAVVAGVPPEVALGSLAGAVIFVTSAVEYPLLTEHCCTHIRMQSSPGKIRYPYIKKKGDVKHFSPRENCMLIVLLTCP